MRVRQCYFSELKEGDDFFLIDPIEDFQGNVYLSKSKFTVLQLELERFNIKSSLLKDEEGREINYHNLSNLQRIYKSFY